MSKPEGSETDQRVHLDAKRWGGWSWREPHHGEHFRRCSFCGSVHPDDLIAETAWVAEWSDMKYGWPHKFYVDIPNRHPDGLFVVSCAYTDHAPQALGSGAPYVARDELTAEQRAIARRDGHFMEVPAQKDPNFFQFGHRPAHFGKFYTIHLRDNDVSSATKTKIERGCGFAFDFRDDGTLAWQPAT